MKKQTTMDYILNRLEDPLREDQIIILKKLVFLSFTDLQMLLKLHSKHFNTKGLNMTEDWQQKTAEFETLIGLAVDYKYYEVFNTTLSDIVHGYDYDKDWIKAKEADGEDFYIDGVFSHLEQSILYTDLDVYGVLYDARKIKKPNLKSK